ncbi:hypothetical protein ACHAWO_012195 [Cyclotella atomus]|jgi:hypothetical protein|uniref:Uncharacterized protein n=1 Tax=Cyclotella atomus TaxID=382360 RepID=A0ABD3PDN4_9STRA
MGRKNKAKRTTASPQDVKDTAKLETKPGLFTGPQDTPGLTFLHTKIITSIDTEPTFRPKPNMTLNPSSMLEKLLSIHPNERTATAERMYSANLMIQEIESLQCHTKSDDTLVDINTLKNDSTYLQECVLWIKAFISSDFRIPCASGVLFVSPVPS